MSDAKQETEVAQRLGTILQIGLSAIAFGVPVLYALGRVYSEAYWTELQLPASVVAYGVEDYIYLGFMAILNSSSRLFSALNSSALQYLFGITAAFAVITIYSIVLDRWLAPVLKRRFRRIGLQVKSWKSPHRKWVADTARLFAGLSLVATTLFFLLATAFLVVALPILGVYSAGKTQAGLDKQELVAAGGAPKKYAAQPILHYRNGSGGAKSSLLLQCSEKWCVVYEGSFFTAVRTEAVERIDHCPKYIQLRNGATVCVDLTDALGVPKEAVGPGNASP